jgi:RNA polymerase sigma-70 factor, ECF subfamily
MASDQELIDRSLGGDAFAFDNLVRRYQHELLRHLLRLCGDGELADELCQETFLKFHRSLARFRRGNKITPLLFTIATNAWRDHVKATFTNVRTTELCENSASYHIDDAILERLEHEAVLAAIDQLRPEFRQMLSLRYYQGLNYREIAELTGVPAGTVATWVHRALEALRAQLQGTGPKEVPK